MKKEIHTFLGNFADTEFSKQYRNGKIDLPPNTAR